MDDLYARFQSVLAHDKSSLSEQFVGLLKSDILKVLKNYFEIKSSDFSVEITPTVNNDYAINVTANATRII